MNQVIAENVTVEMTRKEWETWQAIQEQANRTGGRYGFVLLHFVSGQILVHSVSTQPAKRTNGR